MKLCSSAQLKELELGLPPAAHLSGLSVAADGQQQGRHPRKLPGCGGQPPSEPRGAEREAEET